MAVGRIQSVSGTNALASTCTTGTLTLANGGTFGTTLLALIAHQGSIIDTPVLTVTYAATDSFSFIASSSSTNTTIEAWVMQTPTAATGTVIADFGVGATTSSILAVIELGFVGHAGPLGNPAGANGTVSPITLAFTGSVYVSGRKSTINVPVENNLLYGMCCMNTGVSGSTLSGPTGTLDLNTTAGTLTNTISACTIFKQATAGPDTIAITESLDREWSILICDVIGGAVDGMGVIQSPQVVGTFY